MPVVTKSCIDVATFNDAEDKVSFSKASIVNGTLTQNLEPTVISDPRIRNVTIVSEVRTEPKDGDARNVHQVAFFLTVPSDAPGDVKLHGFKAVRNGVTLLSISNRYYDLERGLQKRIGITPEVVNFADSDTIVEIDISFDLSVSEQDYELE